MAKRQVAILVFDLNGKKIGRFNSLTQTKRVLSLSSIGCISQCCSGESYTYKDMIFIRENEYTPELLKQRVKAAKEKYLDQAKPVFRLNMKGKFIKRYNSLTEAEREGYSRNCIRNVCNNKFNSHAGYKWKWGFKKEEKEIC